MRLATLVLGTSVFLASCTLPQPPVVSGVADFASKDFAQGSLYSLSGRWWATLDGNPAPRLVEVPGLWLDQDWGGRTGPVDGLVTYRLRLVLPPSVPRLKLALTNLQSVSEVWANGVKIGGRGVVSSDPNQYRAEDLPYTVDLPSETPVDLEIRVANWTNGQGGGILAPQWLGAVDAVNRSTVATLTLEVLVGGLFVFMALFTAILYALQRRDRSLLVFTLVSLAFAARHFSGGVALGFFPWGIPFDLVLRCQESSSFLVCAMLSLYFWLVFPLGGQRRVSWGLSVLGVTFFGLAWVTPTPVFSATLPVTQALVYATILNAVVLVVRACRLGTPQAPAYLVVVVLLSLPAAVEALLGSLALPQLTPVGFIPFLMFQSYLLAQRFASNAVEAENLRRINARMKELDQAKTNFLANISHELRTPLTLIQAPVEAVLGGEYGTSVPHDHPVFGVIKTNTVRLLGLVERLLHLTRIEAGEGFDLRAVEYPKLVKNYLSEFESLARQAGVTLTLERSLSVKDGPPVVRLDPRGFETVFFNLLSNALKFTPAGGAIVVKLTRSPSGVARLEVADTGPGIAPEVRETLFARYRQIYDSPRNRYDGHGIGLSLARETARALGGDLGVESQPGRGSRFWFDLPLTDEVPEVELPPPPFPQWLATTDQGEAALANQAGPGEPFRPTILVVEDNLDLRLFIAQTLADYHVVLAKDGREALAQMGHPPLPDLIVSDIMMPEMGGVELFDHCRRNTAWATIPFVFLTARAEVAEQHSLLHRGLAAYLVKPFSTADLRARIASILVLGASGRRAVEERLLEALRAGTPGKSLYPADATAREIEVLRAVVEGKTDKAIGLELGISTRTASNHVASLLRKTGLTSRQSLRQRYS